MLRRRKTTMKDQAELAGELARDKKFRKELLAALGHGAVATRRARERVGAVATLKHLAADEHLREELGEMGASLQRAKGRFEKKRSNRFRNLLLLGAAATVAAVPATRNWIVGRVRGLMGGGEGGGGFAGGPRVIQESIEVEVPISTAYNQWTQFEEFPSFMEGVEEVRQLDDTRLHWVANVGGKRSEWDAKILEQHPDRQISWISEDGKATRGTVTFEELGPNRTRIELSMSYTAEGVAESVGSAAGLDAARVRGDLQRFKQLIEDRDRESGAWRGEIVAGETRS